jgi:DeoR/GlpR family transcriptional regulator of sugar metabolism
MFTEERRQQILQLLAKQNRVFVNDLCKAFDTTPVTIRKDLSVLEDEGQLKRVHGGAILHKALFPGMALTEKEKLHQSEKELIAEQAAKLVVEGDVIAIDSGSTTLQFAKRIKNIKNLTVITNGINIATELLDSDADVILTSGFLDKKSSTLFGPLAENTLSGLTADKLFQGIDGIDLEVGLTTPNIQEAHLSQLMMKISSEHIVLADSSKFGRRSLGVVGRLNEIDKIIIDDKIEDEYVKKMEEEGVEVIIAK